MARKTIDIAQLLTWGNTFLASPDSSSTFATDAERKAQRIGVCALLEAALHHTGNYRGYRMLETEYLPADEQTLDEVLRPGHDSTRRRYLG